MSEPDFDFAIFGSTPLAQFLAGLLAGSHNKKVLLAGENRASYRLPRGIDLSVAPMTRPQSWTILVGTIPEASRLMTRIAGRGTLSRVDPIFFAEGPREIEALSHIRHMAVGFGVAAEPVAQSTLGGNRAGIVLRDAFRLNRAHMETGLEQWLAQSRVQRVVPQSVTVDKDGRVELAQNGTCYSARQAVLADDEAIMAWLPLRQWPTLFRRRQHSSILTAPTRPLTSSIMLELDWGLFLTQQPEGGVAAFGPGERAEFSAHLQGLLGEDRQIVQAGQTSYPALVTRDGAPAFGRVEGHGADIVAGTGCYGAFIAPALARWLAGAASRVEAHWFEQHLVDRDSPSAAVAEFPGFGREQAR
jgi:hypothetical protein